MIVNRKMSICWSFWHAYSVWRRSESRVGLASKMQVWSTLFLFEIYDHVSKGRFDPLFNCSKRQVSSRLGGNSGPNLPFWIIWITCVRCFENGKFGPDFLEQLFGIQNDHWPLKTLNRFCTYIELTKHIFWIFQSSS